MNSINNTAEVLYIQENFKLLKQTPITIDGLTKIKEIRMREATVWERTAQIALLIFATLTILPLVFGLILAREKIEQLWTGEDVRTLIIETEPMQITVLSSPLIQTKYPRKYPNIIGNEKANGAALCFNDTEIVNVIELDLDDTTYSARDGRVKVEKFWDMDDQTKHVLQQQAPRGCRAAVTVMLTLDLEKKANFNSLFLQNLSNTDTMKSDLLKSGLKPCINIIQKDLGDISCLLELINENGSAIVSINDPNLGSHVIIVDGISLIENTVSIRDPYHGWAINVTLQAFDERWNRSDIVVQAKLNPNVSMDELQL